MTTSVTQQLMYCCAKPPEAQLMDVYENFLFFLCLNNDVIAEGLNVLDWF